MGSQLSPGVLSEDIFSALRKASVSTLATQLYTQGIRQPFLVGVGPMSPNSARFAGEAFTMRFIPSREDIEPMSDPYSTGNTLQWEAIESVQPNQVIVVDSQRDTSAASAGDMLIARAQQRGAVGFVTDGALRDGAAIAKLGFPAYAQAVTATTRPASFHVADLQVPIGCAGVAVYPGDVIVGDEDGVVVVPRKLAPKIAFPAAEQEELEDWLQQRVRAGHELWGTYPPNEQTLAEFEAHRENTLQERPV